MACKPQEDESNGWEAGCKLYVESEASHKNLTEHAIDNIPTDNHQHGESTEACLPLAVMVIEDGEEVDRAGY